MPNSLDREAFEAAACLEWPTEEPATLLARSIRTDGYRSRAVDDAWRWWQAGAAAEREACAELCGEMLSTQHEPGTSERRAFNVATIECEMAIRDRGIT